MAIGPSPEVYSATAVRVECPEDILTEGCRVASREHLTVHRDKVISRKFSLWAILEEALVPNLYLLPGHLGGSLQEGEVPLTEGETLLARASSHDSVKWPVV